MTLHLAKIVYEFPVIFSTTVVFLSNAYLATCKVAILILLENYNTWGSKNSAFPVLVLLCR